MEVVRKRKNNIVIVARGEVLWFNRCKKCCMDCKKFIGCKQKCIHFEVTCNQCTYRNFEPVGGRMI